MSEQNITVGDEIDSYCTTCKLVLAHQIVAFVEGHVEKVICKTCGKQHKYRPHPPKSRSPQTVATTAENAGTPSKSATRPAKKSATRTRKTKEPAHKWEDLMAAQDVSRAKTYLMSGVFQQDDVIDHKTFGYGLVTEIKAEGKMRVLFKDGAKLLVCGQA